MISKSSPANLVFPLSFPIKFLEISLKYHSSIFIMPALYLHFFYLDLSLINVPQISRTTVRHISQFRTSQDIAMPFDLPRKRIMRSDVSSYIQGSRGVAWNGHYFVAVIYARDTCVVLGRLEGGAPSCSGAAGRRFSLGLGALLGGCT